MQNFLDHSLQNKLNLYMTKIKSFTVNPDGLKKKHIKWLWLLCVLLLILSITQFYVLRGKCIFFALECLIDYLNYISINKPYAKSEYMKQLFVSFFKIVFPVAEMWHLKQREKWKPHLQRSVIVRSSYFLTWQVGKLSRPGIPCKRITKPRTPGFLGAWPWTF